MLSIENPPDPSSSYNISQLKADEKATQKLALPEADLVNGGLDEQQQLPSFSIRDYVFTARSKDIGANWPFPQQFLQLCLKHGVKDLLPPFEPPNSVRARCCKDSVGSDQLVALTDSEKALAEGNLFKDDNGILLDSERNYIKYKSLHSFDQLALEYSGRVRSPLSEAGNPTADVEDEKSCRLSRSFGLNDAAGEVKSISTVTNHVQIEGVSTPPAASSTPPTDSLPGSVPEINSFSEISIDLQTIQPPYGSDKAEIFLKPPDKCQLIVKSGVLSSESSQTEEIVSNSSSLSEPMASKVCPVCRIFSSTSNTTLNAHIDQCLAMESTSKRAATKLTDHQVKPRKKRSMEDIYATAPRCTVEELERRNGLSRAIGLNSSTSTDEVQAERKRQRLAQVDFVDDGNESAVYVDSNGTKLRILSKFNDSSSAPTVGEDFRLRKHAKDSSEGRIFSSRKKRCLASKCSKSLIVKPRSKKFCSLKLYKGEIRGAPDVEYHLENHEKEESLSQLLKTRDPTKTSGSGTLRQWVRSKRTGPSKTSNEIDGRGVAKDPVLLTWNPSIERNQSTSSKSSAERNHILRFSRSPENSTSSLRSKRLEILSSTVSITDNMEKSSKPQEGNFNRLSKGTSVGDGCIKKFVRSPLHCVSSPRSKRLEIHESTGQASPKLSEIHPFLKIKKISSARKNALSENPYHSMEATKCNENEKRAVFKKLQKDRCMEDRQIGESPSDDEGYDRIHGCQVLGPSSLSLNKIHGTHKSDRLKNIMSFETEENISKICLGRSNLLESGKERGAAVGSSKRKETVSLKVLDLRVPYHTNVVDSKVGRYLQYLSGDICSFKYDDQEFVAEDVPVSMDAGMNCCAEKTVGEHYTRSTESPISEDNLPAYRSSVPSESLEEVEHTIPTFGTELRVESTPPRPFDNREKHCADEVDDLSCFRTASEMDATRLDGDSISDVQHMGSQIDSPPILEGPEACVLGFGDVGFKAPQDNSSVTSSSSFQCTKHKPMVFNRDRAESVCALPPATTSGLKCLKQDSSFGSSTVQEMSSASFSDNCAKPVDDIKVGQGCTLASTASMGRAGRTQLDRKKLKVAVSPAKEPDKFSDDELCCCLRKESASLGEVVKYQESESLRESMMATKMLPTKRKQMSWNVNSGAEVSNYSICSSSRVNEKVIPVLESPTGSISLTQSSDAAGKLPGYSYFGLASPSSSQNHPQHTSNPILRLMGKNLMVVNNDEDESVGLQRDPIAMGSPHDHANAKYLTLLGFSNGYVSNQDTFSFYSQSPNGSMVIGQDQCNVLPNFDAGFANSFRGHSHAEAHQTPLQQPGNHQDMRMGCFVESALQNGGSKGNTDVQARQKRLNSKPNPPFVSDVDRIGFHRQCQKPVSARQTAGAVKEVINIDESPEAEVDLTTSGTKYTTGSREKQPLLRGILPPTILNSSSRPAKAFSCFPSENTFSRGPLGAPKPSFLM
ncbi:uncharacterized protein LOC143879146 [Tasmannia lanceolata]|uniref:uncharacterized protein LOC143879146 n=1 Tax=Tasmannia lanceolata TaxID=3420 RepID=UPI004063CFF8